MNPTLLHLRGSSENAIAILEAWLETSIDPNDHDLETEDNGWVTLSIDLDFLPIESWQSLGSRVDLVYESYSTATRTGELLFFSQGKLVRQIARDAEDPSSDVSKGQLPSEERSPLETWSDIWSYVEDWKWIKEVSVENVFGSLGRQ